MTVISEEHVPYLSPRYRAAFVRAALTRGNTRPFREQILAATRGDLDASQAVAMLRGDNRITVGAMTIPRSNCVVVGADGNPLDLAGRMVTDVAKQLLLTHYRATVLEDDKARDEYNSYVAKARQGDLNWLGGLFELAAIKGLLATKP